MTGQAEVAVNRWPLNQAALKWLKAAKEQPDPQVPYVLQLASWALDGQKVDLPAPLSPSQPEGHEIQALLDRLQHPGPKPAHQAMRALLDYPEMSPAEVGSTIQSGLERASSPEEAAVSVIEQVRQRMIALSPN